MRATIMLLKVLFLATTLLAVAESIADAAEIQINFVNLFPVSSSQRPDLYSISQLLIEESESIPVERSPSADKEENSDIDQEIEIFIQGQPEPSGGSTPVYTIDAEEIRDKGADTLSETLRGLPGFAINDFGYGADIHTGTYYRGASINQSIFLLNGRPIGTNINTYHGTTDLNSILSGDIEEVELSSGTSTTLYGSEASGGIVNITTKQGEGPPRPNGVAQFGSYDQSLLQGSFGGGTEKLSYLFNYEKFETENDYRVPIGAANRGPDGRLFNGDSSVENYYGNLSFDLNPRNNLSLDISKITSRRGLLYFGFPLQRDRLDHDALNIGLSWRSMLGQGEDSELKTTLSFNQDYFNTYGPTQNIFYRTGTLNSRALNGRLEHDWQTSANNNLRWGVDLQNSFLNGEVSSNVPQLAQLNGTQEQERFHTALFALNAWKITDTFKTELGLRQNFNSDFGSYLNPSVGTRWDITPFLALRGSWASVQRNPGLDQLYVFDTVHNWLPNPDLEPEKGSAWTAGVDVLFAPGLTGQFTYFGSSLDDRLGISEGRWENIGLVNTNGLEMALNWQISPQWKTFLNYTYTDAEIETGSQRGLQLALIPYSVAQLGIGYASPGDWRVNLYANYYSGARRALFTNPEDTITDFSPPWLSLDLGLQIPIFERMRLTVFLENLTDNTYEKANRIYQPGLTFRLGVQSTF